MGIQCQEQHRLDGSVYVTTATGYGRYVDASEWDADPQAVAAGIADHLASLPSAPTATSAVNKSTITLSDYEVAEKLIEVATAKAAAVTKGQKP